MNETPKQQYEYVMVACPACGSVNRKVRRACRYCEGAPGVRKRVPVVEETTDELWEQANQLEAQVSAMLDNRSEQVLGSHE
jgi:hypothetical protein